MKSVFFFFSLVFICFVQAQSVDENLLKVLKNYNISNHYASFQFSEMNDDLAIDKLISDFRNKELEFYQIKNYTKFNVGKKEELLLKFLEKEYSIRENDVKVDMANTLFKSNRFSQAEKWFESTDSKNVEDKESYDFYKGYTYLKNGKHKKSSEYLYPIAENSGHNYYREANYYLGIQSFNNGKYQEAKQYLLKINKIKEYKRVDFLIAQVHFIDGNYDEVVKLLEGSEEIQNQETIHLLANSYFELDEFKKAKNKFKEFVLNSEKIDPEDMYKLAFSSYKVGDYKEAIEYFKELQLSEKFGQYSMYALGDCYLRLKDKKNALNAFMSAEKFSKDKEIKEVSTFNVAKLQFDLKNYNIANLTFEKFIKEYTSSHYIEEAQHLYTQSLLLSNNYPKAILYLENNPKLLYKNEKLYQEITYTYAVNAYNNNEIEKSKKYIQKSLSRIKDKPLSAEAHYLRAEIDFKEKDYHLARNQYNEVFKVIYNHKVFFSQNANLFNTHYGLAYCDYIQKYYDKALMHFKECTKNYKLSQKDPASNVLQDVELRMGDIYFIKKEYDKAFFQYSKISKGNDRGYDYATLQKANIEGVRKNYGNKIKILKKLLNEVPNSIYRNNARYQLGVAYEDDMQIENAKKTYEKIIAEKEYSDLQPKSTIRLATINYNSGNKAEALKYYSNIVEKYPNSSETDQSLKAIKEIFLSDGKAEEYIAYINKLPNAKQITMSAQDSILFETGEEFFANEKYDNAINIFNKYIDKFPSGKFLHKAYYLKAESYVEKSQYKDAIIAYNVLIDYKDNPYYETALVKSAYYNYNVEKNYSETKNIYEKLLQFATKSKNSQLAKIGLLESNYNLKNYDKVVEIANLIEQDKNIEFGIKRDATYYKAISLYKLEKYNEAVPMLNIVLEDKNSYRSAECSYLMATIAHKKKQYSLSNDILFKAKDDYGSYQDWIVRYYVLIGYNYHKLGDDFQAKATLESIVQNYEGDEKIILDAKNKLLEVNESIKSNSKVNY